MSTPQEREAFSIFYNDPAFPVDGETLEEAKKTLDLQMMILLGVLDALQEMVAKELFRFAA